MTDSLAEQGFKSVVDLARTALVPAGFTKRGTKFVKFYGPNLAIIQFQRSRHNDGGQIRFTINVSIVSAILARELWGVVDLNRTSESHGHLRQRIGYFSDEPRDIWWAVGDASAGEVGANVLELLSRVLSSLGGSASDKDLLAMWRTGRAPGLTAFQHEQYAAILERLQG
ncbi:MAG: DUF4304 domain-containing protein [bacterium]|jgi:hypothetical protein